MKVPTQSILFGMPSLLHYNQNFSENWPTEKNLPPLQKQNERNLQSKEWIGDVAELEIQDQGNCQFIPEIKRKQKKCKKITKCPHNDRKHYAKSMCNNCYHIKARSEKATTCEHKESTMYAKGLCLRCYHRNYKRQQSKSKKSSSQAVRILQRIIIICFTQISFLTFVKTKNENQARDYFGL